MEQVPAHGAFDLDELTAAERDRLLSFASSERRRQFVLGRLAARRLVGTLMDMPSADVDLQFGTDGAPRVQEGYVSIAHGGRGFGAFGLAASAKVPIGVDAETIRPRHPRLAHRILRTDESDVIDLLGGDDASALTLVWALKESVMKGQRTGLRAGTQSVRLTDVDLASASGWADSEVSGVWRLSFLRRDDVWIAVALKASGGR